MNQSTERVCACGKKHKSSVKEVVVQKGAISLLPQYVRRFGANKVFVLADVNTFAAAGQTVCDTLDAENISYAKYVFDNTALEPDEHAVGAAVMHYDTACDMVVAVGSGVINDIGKILSHTVNHPYIIVGTAPSMDGYASATSSVAIDGLKVSLASKCPEVIVGDIDVLKNAPMEMLQAGLGDMLAKYISICEWRIGHIVTGEYYCEEVAQQVRTALKKCTDNAAGLLKREETAVKAVFEGLVIGGMAMEYAGVSRPASGAEHYISHIWDMRGLAKGTPVALHGIQCGIATLVVSKIYAQLVNMVPDREKALAYAQGFDLAKWNDTLLDFVGEGAKAMVALEKKEQKYSTERHKERLEIIINHWDDILKIIAEEVPAPNCVAQILENIGAPKTCEEIGIDSATLPVVFRATKDIRDKYVLSRLLWDLGVLEEITF